MIVLDTHIWFWWVSGQHQRFSAGLLETLATAAHIGVSAVSCFEIALACRRGRIELPHHHRDPFDRIIIATALEVDGQLASVDREFSSYPELTGRLLA